MPVSSPGTNGPWRLALARGARKCQRLGQSITQQRTTQQEGEPCGRCVAPLLPRAEVHSRSHPGNSGGTGPPRPRSWAPGPVGARTTPSRWGLGWPGTRYLFFKQLDPSLPSGALLCPTLRSPGPGPAHPPSQGWAHRLRAGHWVCSLPGQVAASLSPGTHSARPRTNRATFLGRAWRCRLGLFRDMSQIFPFFSCLSGPADTPAPPPRPQLILHCLPTLLPLPSRAHPALLELPIPTAQNPFLQLIHLGTAIRPTLVQVPPPWQLPGSRTQRTPFSSHHTP